MNQFARYSLAVFLLLAADRAQITNAQDTKAAKKAAQSTVGGNVDRGRYIVESIAMCGDCHTPRNDAGEMVVGKMLSGAPILQPVPGWATYAPRLAGTPPGTDEEFVRLLTTAVARTGLPPRWPMHRYTMTRPDAEAVLAYLKSLRK